MASGRVPKTERIDHRTLPYNNGRSVPLDRLAQSLFKLHSRLKTKLVLRPTCIHAKRAARLPIRLARIPHNAERAAEPRQPPEGNLGPRNLVGRQI